jgi:hypothetical protein
MPIPPWSHTLLNTYEICPKQCYHRYVARDVPKEDSKALRWGNAVHSAFEKRLKSKVPLPDTMAHWEPFARFFDKCSNLQVELKLAIDKDLKPVDFWSKDAWGRGKLDVTFNLKPYGAWIVDHKTGKRREDPSELETFAVLLRAHYPTLNPVYGRYLWLADDGLGNPFDLGNSCEARLASIRSTLDQMLEHERFGHWPAKEGPLCGWCPVTQCSFNKRGKI